MDTKYKIGDTVYYPYYEAEQVWETCPDCGGTKHIRCILYTGEELTIQCEGCKRGYEDACGKVRVYKRLPHARQGTIAGVTLTGEGTE